MHISCQGPNCGSPSELMAIDVIVKSVSIRVVFKVDINPRTVVNHSYPATGILSKTIP